MSSTWTPVDLPELKRRITKLYNEKYAYICTTNNDYATKDERGREVAQAAQVVVEARERVRDALMDLEDAAFDLLCGCLCLEGVTND